MRKLCRFARLCTFGGLCRLRRSNCYAVAITHACVLHLAQRATPPPFGDITHACVLYFALCATPLRPTGDITSLLGHHSRIACITSPTATLPQLRCFMYKLRAKATYCHKTAILAHLALGGDIQQCYELPQKVRYVTAVTAVTAVSYVSSTYMYVHAWTRL